MKKGRNYRRSYLNLIMDDMTRDKMIKVHWIPYMKILYKTPNMKDYILCMLCGINFESEVATLIPLDDKYESEEFFMSIDFIEIPRPGLKKVI